MVELGRIVLRLAAIFAVGGAASELFGPITAVPNLFVSSARAQSPSIELSANVTLDEADAVARGQLERVKRLIADRQWDESIETLRQVSDQRGDKVIAVSPGYFVRIRDYCHRRFASMPAEALKIYRDQVDSQAKQWFDDGSKNRDEGLLRRIVDQFYVSSYGDDALWLLGEMALERGDYGSARGHWEQLIETPPAVIADDDYQDLAKDASLTSPARALLDRYYRRNERLKRYELFTQGVVDPDLMRLAVLLRSHGIVGPRLAYPAAAQPPADVFARLILTSILEGSTAWAEAGLRDLAKVYPDAQGRLGGRETNFVAGLTTLLEASREWPREERSTDWRTFAGNAARNRTAITKLEVGRIRWRRPLTQITVSPGDEPTRRTAEDRRAALSYHPIVVGDKAFVATPWQILGFDLKTGNPAWGGDHVIFRPENLAMDSGIATSSVAGVPRFTLTAHRDRLYARMGTSVTSVATDGQPRSAGNILVCLDLAQEGAYLWKIEAPDERWSFEGAPLADDDRVYVAMRKGGGRPQAHVACFDAESKALLWRRLICSAETPAQGQRDEITNNLLTMVGDTIYYNTNLGAVAALSKHDGEVRWTALYPRAVGGDPNLSKAHFQRDLTPCVYDRGTLFVAPSDSRHILAFDANSGLLLWETSFAEDVVHLLGTGGDYLYATGDYFYGMLTTSGYLKRKWPDRSPKGYGRGVLMSGQAIWPTHKTLEVFSFESGERVRSIDLSVRRESDEDLRPTGGNVVPAGDVLLIAGTDELVAYDRHGGIRAAPSADAPVSNPADPDARPPMTFKRVLE